MHKVSSAYTGYTDFELDLSIFSKTISINASESDLRLVLLKGLEPKSENLETFASRYEVSGRVSSNFHIKYNADIEVDEDEELVSLEKPSEEEKRAKLEELEPIISNERIEEILESLDVYADNARKAFEALKTFDLTPTAFEGDVGAYEYAFYSYEQLAEPKEPVSEVVEEDDVSYEADEDEPDEDCSATEEIDEDESDGDCSAVEETDEEETAEPDEDEPEASYDEEPDEDVSSEEPEAIKSPAYMVSDDDIDEDDMFTSPVVEIKVPRLDIIVPVTKKVVETIDKSSEPRELRAFLRKHPDAEIPDVLKCFSKDEIRDAIKMGKVVKKGNKLKL